MCENVVDEMIGWRRRVDEEVRSRGGGIWCGFCGGVEIGVLWYVYCVCDVVVYYFVYDYYVECY